MHAWLEPILFNVVGAGILAAMAALVTARTKRPAVAHVLWLLVLLKLVSPPLLEIALVPPLDRWLQERPAASASATAPVGPAQPAATAAAPLASAMESPAPARRAAWGLGLLGTAATGTVLLLLLAGYRFRRFRRLLRASDPAPADVRAAAARLARHLGVPRPPRIRLVAATIPPALWPRLGGCDILLPAALLPRLTPAERDMLLAHELAHVRRRDHWIRPVELLVVALYWWLPVSWWARRNLRRTEEESCDALVLQKLPGRGRAYATALLRTVDFLALRSQPVPALATGAGPTRRLEERLTMILKHEPQAPLPARLRPLLLAVAVLALLVSPAWVEKSETATRPTATEKEHQIEMLQIQRQELQLQKQLRELEVRRMQVQARLETAMLQHQKDRMLEEIRELEKEGQKASADAMRRELAMMEREAALHHQQLEFEQQHQAQRAALEFELHDLALEQEALRARGDDKRARESMQRTLQLQLELRRLELQALQAELGRNNERLRQETEQLESVVPEP